MAPRKRKPKTRAQAFAESDAAFKKWCEVASAKVRGNATADQVLRAAKKRDETVKIALEMPDDGSY